MEHPQTDTIAQARADERARVISVLRHPEAVGREDLALTMLDVTELGLDAIVEMLRTVPRNRVLREVPSQFADVMATLNPVVVTPA